MKGSTEALIFIISIIPSLFFGFLLKSFLFGFLFLLVFHSMISLGFALFADSKFNKDKNNRDF